MSRLPKLYREDLSLLEQELRTLVQSCSSRGALFLDPEGRCLAGSGNLENREDLGSRVAAYWIELEKLAASFGGKAPNFQIVSMDTLLVCIRPGRHQTLLAVVNESDKMFSKVISQSGYSLEKLSGVLLDAEDRRREGDRISDEFKDSDPPWPGTPLPA